jgi:hypothetical protein
MQKATTYLFLLIAGGIVAVVMMKLMSPEEDLATPHDTSIAMVEGAINELDTELKSYCLHFKRAPTPAEVRAMIADRKPSRTSDVTIDDVRFFKNGSCTAFLKFKAFDHPLELELPLRERWNYPR